MNKYLNYPFFEEKRYCLVNISLDLKMYQLSSRNNIT